MWALQGGVVALGTGRTIASLHGVQEVALGSALRPVSGRGRAVALPSPGDAGKDAERETHAAELVSRAALFYTEPGTRRRMRTFRYRPTTPKRGVSPVIAPAAPLRLSLLADGGLSLTRPDGAAAKTAVGPPMPGRKDLRAAWVYVGRQRAPKQKPGTSVRPAVIETYDYRVGKDANTVAYSRVGRCPSWYGPGQCVTHLTGTRIDGGWSGIEPAMRGWLAEIGRKMPLGAGDVIVGKATGADGEDGTLAVAVSEESKRRRKLFGFF